MAKEDDWDWRLLNHVAHLHKQKLEPTDGEELMCHTPNLKKCIFCWDLDCCICEICYNDLSSRSS